MFTEAGLNPTLPLAAMCGSGMLSVVLSPPDNASAVAVYVVSLTTVEINLF